MGLDKNTLRDGNSTVLYAVLGIVDPVYTVKTVDMVYTVDTFDTVSNIAVTAHVGLWEHTPLTLLTLLSLLLDFTQYMNCSILTAWVIRSWKIEFMSQDEWDESYPLDCYD